MSLTFQLSTTATGKAELLSTRSHARQEDLPAIAQQVVETFQMTVLDTVAGFDECLLLTAIGEDRFCVSWDIWFNHVSVIAWEQTPDEAVRKLASRVLNNT